MEPMEPKLNNVIELMKFVEQLRDPQQGDPWILAQDFKSLASLTIEEAYEFADSLEQNDFTAIADELGDLLLHVILYAKLGEELNQFDLGTVAQKSLAKQKQRKLYFKNPQKISEEEALQQWEQNKKKEREAKGQPENISALDDIAKTIPAINRAMKLQTQAALVGFDWPDAEPVFEKFTEELAEIKEVLEKENNNAVPKNEIQDELTDELGDLFFTCINLARKLNVNPDTALRQANQKFESRFRAVENELKQRGKKPADSSLEEMDAIWEQVKQRND